MMSTCTGWKMKPRVIYVTHPKQYRSYESDYGYYFRVSYSDGSLQKIELTNYDQIMRVYEEYLAKMEEDND